VVAFTSDANIYSYDWPAYSCICAWQSPAFKDKEWQNSAMASRASRPYVRDKVPSWAAKHRPENVTRALFCNEHVQFARAASQGIVPPWNHAVFVRAKNLPFSATAVKNGRFQWQDLCWSKTQFYRNGKATLIKSMKPMERLSFDFKGPVPSRRGNINLLFVIDEYSRFHFVFPCIDMTALTVIRCLDELLTLYGTASLIHSYNRPTFTSKEFNPLTTKFFF